MRLSFTALLACVVLLVPLTAQDQHFSQFYAAPLSLNPALTGTFDGRFRVSAIYRDQWSKVLDHPYRTFATSLDLRWPLGKRLSTANDAFAVGVQFFSDKAGTVDFSTTQIAISGAFHKVLDLAKTQFLSLGFQGGIAQRNINYENVTFEDQFDGVNGYVDPTAENLPENNFAFGDLSVGLNYTYSAPSRLALFAGFAVHHILEPSVSFYSRGDEVDNFPSDKLHRKYSAQLSLRLPLADKVHILPRAIYSNQGPHTKFDAGANFRFVVNDLNGIALHLGGYLRQTNNVTDGFGPSEFVTLLGLEYSNVLFGLSYDFNLDDLANTRQGQRTFELSVAYLGNYEDEIVLCPKF